MINTNDIVLKRKEGRISVCMATYNGEKYIDRQLKSILSQIGVDDEIIISDDRSSDKTLELIEKINDKRIIVDTNRGKRGPLENFEIAIKRATGDYIFLADQDDIWLPSKVAVMLSLLQENDLVLSNCKVINSNDEVIRESFFRYRGSKPGFWKNLYKNSYLGCCMAFNRSVLSYVLPFPSQIHMHDWWIGLLVGLNGRVYFYPEPLILYVRHGENASPTGETGYGFKKQLQNRFVLILHVVKRLFFQKIKSLQWYQ